MRALVIYTHPNPESFTAAVRDRVVETLSAGGHEVELLDLYGEGFDPLLTEAEWRAHLDPPSQKPEVAGYVAKLKWAQTVVFVHPTWWSGPPAMLSGWFQRVLIHGDVFELGRFSLRGRLRNIRRLYVITSHGSPAITNWAEGHIGRSQILRGLRSLCHPLCRTKFLPLYKIDHATREQRGAFLERVASELAKLN